MDITKCVKGPIVLSLPHFYLTDKSYQDGVNGLHPTENDHGIIILFESVSQNISLFFLSTFIILHLYTVCRI